MKRGTKVKFQPLVVLTQFVLTYIQFIACSALKKTTSHPKKNNIKTTCKLPCMFSAFHNTHANKHTNRTTHTTYKSIAKTWGLTATENKQQMPNPCALFCFIFSALFLKRAKFFRTLDENRWHSKLPSTHAQVSEHRPEPLATCVPLAEILSCSCLSVIAVIFLIDWGLVCANFLPWALDRWNAFPALGTWSLDNF